MSFQLELGEFSTASRGKPQPLQSQPTLIPDDLHELFPSGTGTVVVWSKVYRLEEGQRAPDTNALRVEIVEELSRIFRYFLNDGIVISVNGKKLRPYDPLMLMERSWADFVLQK